MKTEIAVTGLLSGLLFTAVQPAVADDGLSVGISATRASVAVNDASTNIDGDSSGHRIFANYMFNRNYGIEAGFSSFGKPDDTSIQADMEVETESFDVFGVGKYWLNDKLSVIAKAGFVQSETETEIGDDELTERVFRETGPALGLGGQYDISRNFSLRSEFEWRDLAESGADQILSISGVIRFQ